MARQSPCYLGKFSPMVAGDVDDFAFNLTNILGSDTLSSATVAMANAGGTVAGTIASISVVSPTVSWRCTAPSTAGVYTFTAVCTISDARKLTYTANIHVE